ncbi:Uncharacterised protein [Mycobacteroides abscessus subsp. abscessus]|nr:Uncharacterised protein [Mycobacteroides abscessus subsp. abscessus]
MLIPVAVIPYGCLVQRFFGVFQTYYSLNILTVLTVSDSNCRFQAGQRFTGIAGRKFDDVIFRLVAELNFAPEPS